MLKIGIERAVMTKFWNANTFLHNVYLERPVYVYPVEADYSDVVLDQDIGRLHQAWDDLQGNRNRDAVYDFLAEIFSLVGWWAADRKVKSRAARIVARCGIRPAAVIEPFAALIVVAAYPVKVDKRTGSKWSRVLRYASEFKVPSEPLIEFIKGKGGLNACASRYSRRLRRRARHS